MATHHAVFGLLMQGVPYSLVWTKEGILARVLEFFANNSVGLILTQVAGLCHGYRRTVDCCVLK
jgi:hypothetical protein